MEEELDSIVNKIKDKQSKTEETIEDNVRQDDDSKNFEELGVCSEICEAVKKMGYKHPSKIQVDSLPYTLDGRDIIGLAETGSGKTAAFAIPVIQ